MDMRSDTNKGKRPTPLVTQKGHRVFHIIKMVALILLPILFKINVKGRKNIPATGPFVLLPKHQRWLDVPLIGSAVARYLYYVAKAELFTHPLGNWFIGALGGIPLNRKRPIESRQTLRAIRHCLKSDSGLVLFPEGTYYPDKMGPGHQGVLRFITATASVSLIPVGVRYEKRMFRTAVTIRFGAPVKWTINQEPEELLPIIMKDIASLSGMEVQHPHQG